MNKKLLFIGVGIFLILSSSFGWSQGGNVGSGSATFEVVPVEKYNIPLYPGWNFISTPYQLVNETLESFIESINEVGNEKWNLMWLKSKEYCGPPYFCWLQNKIGIPYTIKRIDNLQGYWINISQDIDKNITATGIHYYKEIEIPVYNSSGSWDGWNMIGYPRNETISVMDLLNDSLGSNWSMFETYEKGRWEIADQGIPQFLWSLTDVTHGKGYYIKMEENDTLIIPETT